LHPLNIALGKRKEKREEKKYRDFGRKLEREFE
jgi:hypothetical protein